MTQSSMEELKKIVDKHAYGEVKGAEATYTSGWLYGDLVKELEEYISTNFIPREEVEGLLNTEVGENLGMGILDSHQKTAIKGFKEYIRSKYALR